MTPKEEWYKNKRWFTKEELVGVCAFDIGAADHLAHSYPPNRPGWWWTLDRENYYGPHKGKKQAQKAYRRAGGVC